MTDVDVFGPFIDPTDIGDAVVNTLTKWLPTYCAVVERHIAQVPGWLPVPTSLTVADDLYHWPEDPPPAVVIHVPGTLDTPVSDGGRNYRARWDVRIATFVSTNDRVSTERLAKHYALVMRLLLLGKGTLGGFAVDTDWLGEKYDPRTNDRLQRTLGCSEVHFSVDVRNVARAKGGPTAPTTQVPSWTTAQTVKASFTP